MANQPLHVCGCPNCVNLSRGHCFFDLALPSHLLRSKAAKVEVGPSGTSLIFQFDVVLTHSEMTVICIVEAKKRNESPSARFTW